MKMYSFPSAPNPRRVRIYLAEKGLNLPLENIDIQNRLNRNPEFLKKNSLGSLPVLELDDGSHMTESVAIVRYLEALHPTPPLLGTTALEKARVEEWIRRTELEVHQPIRDVMRHTSPNFKERVHQFPDVAKSQIEYMEKILNVLDAELGSRAYLAGDNFTFADIVGAIAVDRGPSFPVHITPEHKNLQRWFESVSSRPSFKA